MKSAREKSRYGKIIAIVGPTASGKSALAMELAQQCNGEIICADSRTIYRGFNIGTAKPTEQDQQRVPHHLLDICEPGEGFSVAQFKKLAEKAMQNIWQRGKVALLVGGSGMYVDAVLFDYTFRAGKTHDEPEEYSQLSLEQMQSIVQQRYPKESKSIDQNNRLRLAQILERGLAHDNDRRQLAYDCLILGLNPDRLLLKQKIDDRIEDMLNNGFIQEVKNLIKQYGHDCPQLGIIGYKHAASYIQGEISIQDMQERFARDDRALAKRQETWFKRNASIVWVSDYSEANQLANNYLNS